MKQYLLAEIARFQGRGGRGVLTRDNSIGNGMERNGTERQGRISTKVFRGSRPGEEAPQSEQQRRHIRTTNSQRAFLASSNNTPWDKGGDGDQQLVLLGFYMVGEEETGTVCIAKTKHLAGSLVWSGLYGFWTFLFISFFFPWIASCSIFHHHSKERVGWEEIPLICPVTLSLLVTWFLS